MTMSETSDEPDLGPLDRILDKVTRIEAALVVRDPGNRMSADAYHGLRQQVIASATQRRAHLVCLADLQTALDNGSDAEGIQLIVSEWATRVGLEPSLDVDNRDYYEVPPNETPPHTAQVIALIDSQTKSVIRRGMATSEPSGDLETTEESK